MNIQKLNKVINFKMTKINKVAKKMIKKKICLMKNYLKQDKKAKTTAFFLEKRLKFLTKNIYYF